MDVEVVQGDLLDQQVDVIVNPWNQNIIPWWLLIPHGVSGAIKKQGGLGIFRELRKQRTLPLGKDVYTSAGKFPFMAIIHVASVNLFGHTSKEIIEDSTRNAVMLAEHIGATSIAFPIVGSGSGGFDEQAAKARLVATLQVINAPLSVVLVRYKAA